MTIVYDLWHIYEKNGEDEEKHIGIYSTRENAEAAILRKRDQEGFRNYPNGFKIFETTLDRDQWSEGFITVEEALREFETNDK